MPRSLALLAVLCLVGLSYLLFGGPSKASFDFSPSEGQVEREEDSGRPARTLQGPRITEAAVADSAPELGKRSQELVTDISRGVTVELIGYPESVEPRIVKQLKAGGPPPTSPQIPISGMRSELSNWAFPNIPAGEKWQVMFFRQSPGGSVVPAEALLPRVFVGPTDREPVIHVTCELSDGPGVTGVFVDHESGEPIAFTLNDAARFQVSAHSALGPHKSVKYWIELFPQGRFIAQPLAYAAASHRLAEVRSIQFLDLSKDLASEVELTVSADQTWMDLGEVRLGEAQPFLKVQLADVSGAAVAGARIQLQAELHELGTESRWDALDSGRAKISDVDGVVRYFAPSVDEAFAFGYSASFLEGREPIERMRVKASAPGYVPVEQEFASSTQEVQLVMSQACELKWRVRRGDLRYTYLCVVAIPAGADPTSDQFLERVIVDKYHPSEDGEWLQGSFDKLHPGLIDIVVMQQEGGWEIMRAQNVVVYPKDAQESNQVIDLDVLGNIHWFEVVWIDSKGERVSPVFSHTRYEYMSRMLMLGGSETRCTVHGVLSGSAYRFAIPRSTLRVSGVLGPSNSSGVRFENLNVGTHQFILPQD